MPDFGHLYYAISNNAISDYAMAYFAISDYAMTDLSVSDLAMFDLAPQTQWPNRYSTGLACG